MHFQGAAGEFLEGLEWQQLLLHRHPPWEAPLGPALHHEGHGLYAQKSTAHVDHAPHGGVQRGFLRWEPFAVLSCARAGELLCLTQRL